MSNSVLRWHLHRLLVDRLSVLRPFSGNSGKKRLLILSETDQIPKAQIFPFLYHAEDFSVQYGVDIRELPLARFLDGRHPYAGQVDAVCFQTGFHLSPAEMLFLVKQISTTWPAARLAYFDWFAPTDLRYAEVLNPYVSAYLKKHLLKDMSRYGQPTLGDTNLCDYYSRRFDLSLPEICFSFPEEFQEKLLLGSHFAFCDYLITLFLGPFPAREGRAIDVHSRIAVNGSEWYSRMRQEALDNSVALEGRRSVICRGRVSRKAFFKELNNSKLCFSPFGYGEVCWRDFEAMATGSVLLKPDMSHLLCAPEVFFPGETYVPIAWDLSDLEEKVDFYLARPQERERIARNAFELLHDYLQQGRFVSDSVPLLQRLNLSP